MEILSTVAENVPVPKLDEASAGQIQGHDKLLLWNKEIPSVVDSCLHDIIAAQVHEDPNSQAICAWDGNLTYSELDSLSSRLASYLIAEGVEPEDFVVLCFEKSKWAVVSILAVLKAGGAFVLLDPSSPPARLSAGIQQTKSRITLLSPKNADIFASLVDKVIVIDTNMISTILLRPEALAGKGDPHNPAYVIFTSGSTGQPKGVVIEHCQIATSCVHHGPAMAFGNWSRVLQFASFSFDACILEIVTTLVHGGTICIPSDWERQNDLVGAMNRMRVNCAFTTPSLLKSIDLENVKTLDTLIIGGELIPQSLVDTWTPRLRLILAYGPAECSVVCFTLDTSKQSTPSVGDIGRGVGCRTWIVRQDDVKILADIGTVGELVIEGPVVARGYLGDDEKTKSKFIQNPTWVSACQGDSFQQKPTFYRTGDLVKYNNDGSIRFIGRADNQVKIRGQRLELGEVEIKLQQCVSGMEQLVASHVLVEAITLPDRQDSKVLIAMLCLEISEEVGYFDWSRQDGALVVTSNDKRERFARLCSDIEERLRLQLPTYALPTFYVPLKSIPFAISGKADRKKLRSAVEALSTKKLGGFTMIPKVSSILATMSQSPNEESLHSVWVRVFGIEAATLKSSDNFFWLGGDSVLAIRMVGEARMAGIGLTVETIFKHPVLSDMASAVSQIPSDNEFDTKVQPFSSLGEAYGDAHSEAISQCGVTEDQIEDIYQCSPMQTGLWYASTRYPGAYIMQLVYSLPYSLDLDQFQAAWDAAVLQSPILRARFIDDSSGLLQVIIKGVPVIEFEEIKSLNDVLSSEKCIQMDHGQPLSRLTLVRQSDQQSLHLVWTVHHAIMDGWSASIVENFVEKYYFDGPNTISKGPDFNAFVQHVSRSDKEKARSFWRAHLESAPVPSFPCPPALKELPYAIRYVDHEVTSIQIKGATIATVVQAAWTILVGMNSNSTDVVTGVTLNGRTTPITQIEDIAGPTITTVPFRTRFTGDQSLTDVLDSIQKQYINIIPFQHLGLHNIRDLNKEISTVCTFDSILVIQSTTGDQAKRIFLERKHSFSSLDCALLMETELHPNGVSLRATFDENRLSERRVRRILGQFAHLIRRISFATKDKSVKVSDVQDICDTDLKQIMEWNQEGVIPEPTEKCIHNLVQLRAQSQPDAPAVCAWDGNLSYETLNTYASHLAAHLVSNYGVGLESLVPVCFEKSLWYVVSILAVMKTGGACVPMDPKHPASRMRTIIDRLGDKGANLILTSQSNIESLSVVGPRLLAIGPALFEALNAKEIVQLPHESKPQNAAVVVFTSGSTGTPKGIVIEHRALSTSLIEHGTFIRLSVNSRVLQFAAHTFDISIGDIFATLVHGGCICIPSEDERMNNLAGSITNMNVNHVSLTSTVASQIEPQEVPSLKTLILAGEPMTRKLVEDWADRVTLINMYGPAECTIYCIGKVDIEHSTEPSNIGQGIGALVWIVDEHDHNKLLPIGSIGEILIEGATVARGYLGDEEQTSAAFIENPIWAITTGAALPRRFYKTGDLAYYNDDGSIAFVGRNDGQVKLHGQRIEMGEVEYQLKKALSDNVEAAVSIVTPNGGRSSLTAFIVIRTEKDDITEPQVIREKSELRHFQAKLDGLQDKMALGLPTYMVPETFIPVSCLPLSASGKTDRKRLRAIASQLSLEELISFRRTKSRANQRLQPTTPTEKTLQILWQQLLDHADVKLSDDFFRLGGDSVIAMRLVALSKKQGIKISVEQIFKKPVLADQALVASRCLSSISFRGPSTISLTDSRLIHH